MLRLLSTTLLLIQTVHCSCPAGYDLYNDHECRGKYKLVETFFDEAADEVVEKCAEVLGSPMIIHNNEDQNYWRGWARGGTGATVLGLSCNSTSRKWEWTDGSALDYKPRQQGYDPALNEDCLYKSCVYMTWDGMWIVRDGHDAYATNIICSMPLRQPISTATTPPPVDECKNFDEEVDDGVCYKVAGAVSNWEEAKNTCDGIGASIASVHNDRENSFIRRLAVAQGAVNGVLLGGTPTGKGNELGWADGKNWDYDNFYPGFPMNGLGECLMMDTATTTGEWANVDCATNLNVVCMRQRHYPPPACSSGPWVEGQVIYSPGYPYDASASCDYILSVDAGKRVELEIQVLEANPCCDHLILYENYFGAIEIANLTGIISYEKYMSVSNFMRVSWQPDGGQNVKGVIMTFRGV